MKVTMEQARKNTNLTQEDVSKLLGVARRTYIDYEKGRKFMTIDKCKKFCKITNQNINNIDFVSC